MIRPGDTLADRYRLDDLLSESGSGRFWRAHDQVLQRPVALHVIACGDERSAGLLDAARRSAAVIDPRILRVLDAQMGDDTCFVVNEWGAGTSLDIALASNGPLVPRRAAWLVAEVADSVAQAHAAGVHHGRLVPENVLIDATGSIRVIGFSVDAALHGLPPGDEMGDVRDLAGLLYAALTGRWAGESSSAVPPAPQDGTQVLRPRQVRAGVPRPLDDLADELLNPDSGRARGVRDVQHAAAVASFLSDFVGDPAGIAESLALANPTRAPEPVVLEQVPDFALQPPPPEPVTAGETPVGLFSDEGGEACEGPDGPASPDAREPQQDRRLQAAARAVASGAAPALGRPGSVALAADTEPHTETETDEVAEVEAEAEADTVVEPEATAPVTEESDVPAPRSRDAAKAATRAARTHDDDADPIGTRIDYFTSLFAHDGGPAGDPDGPGTAGHRPATADRAAWEGEDWSHDDPWPEHALDPETEADAGAEATTEADEQGDALAVPDEELEQDRADVAAETVAPDLADDPVDEAEHTDVEHDEQDEQDPEAGDEAEVTQAELDPELPAWDDGPTPPRSAYSAEFLAAFERGDTVERMPAVSAATRPRPERAFHDALAQEDARAATPPPARSKRSLADVPAWLRLTLLGALLMVLLVAFALGSRGGSDEPDVTSDLPAPTDSGGPVITGLTARLFDPSGNPGSAAQGVGQAVDDDLGTAWSTGTFTDQFSPQGARSGIGIVVDTGAQQPITRVDLALQGAPSHVAVYVTSQLPQSVGTLRSVGDFDAGAQESISTPEGTTGRYVVVYLTRLPQVGANYEGGIADVTVHG
jgi:hypothetical protein